MMVDAIGRRLLLQSIVLPNLVGWVVIAFSETYIFLCVGRFITGFTIGELVAYFIGFIGLLSARQQPAKYLFGIGLLEARYVRGTARHGFVH